MSLVPDYMMGGFWRDDSATKDETTLDRIPSPVDAQQDSSGNDASLIDFYRNVPGVDAVQIVKDGGVNNSAIVSLKDGSSCYVEIKPEYFRHQQERQRPITEAQARVQPLPELEPAKVKIFAAMLDELKAQGLHAVVNAIEDASIYYKHPFRTKQIRALVEQTIEPMVKARGYNFIRIDWDQFDATDYFDFTHLNCRGAQKLAPLLADKLRPLLRQ